MLLVSAGVWPQENAFGGKYVNAFEADSTAWKGYVSYTDKESTGSYALPTSIMHGDTMINGKKWKIFNHQGGSGHIKGLVRTEGSKVIFRPYPGLEKSVAPYFHKQTETPIYDFSLKVGDTFAPVGMFGASGTVKRIDSVMLNDGHKHRRLHFEFFSWIEGLGSDVQDPFFMLAPIDYTMQTRQTFLCCHVNGKLLYINPKFENCDGQKVANVIITGGLSEAKVWFADGQLTVSLEDGRTFDVAVFNAQGMLVAQQQQNRYETRIPFGNEAKGVYFVRIRAGQAVATHKVVHARNE